MSPRAEPGDTVSALPRPLQGLVVFAKSKALVSAFYQRTLGLEVVESEASHDLLRGKGHELLIHAIPPRYAADITLSRPPEPREDTPFKPTFVVSSLGAVRLAAEATGGVLQPDGAAWRFRGHLLLDGWDPEGNIVQFQQPEGSA